jgi:hypothetical protein
MNRFAPVAVAALLLGVAACGSSNAPTSAPTPQKTILEMAMGHCSDEVARVNKDGWDDATIKSGDEGHSILISGVDGNKGFKALGCLLGGLETSEAIVSNMNNTTSLMGRQTATDGDLTYEWSYHPDNGLDMTIVMN